MPTLLLPVSIPSKRTWILFLVFCLCAGAIIPAPGAALTEKQVPPPDGETTGYRIITGGYYFPLLPVYIAPLQVATKAPVNISTTAAQKTIPTVVPTRTLVTAVTTKAPVNPVVTTPKGIPFATMTPRTLLPQTTLLANISTTRTLQPTCMAGMTACSGGCVDLDTDIYHCGSCENVCPQCSGSNQPALRCIDGKCMRDCGSGYTDIESDPNNCGCCGNVVIPPKICHEGSYSLLCDGQYFPSNDINNCGACGVQCRPELNEQCYVDHCACIEGYSRCNGVCIPTHNDTANCGGCGISCRADQICYQGTCECPPVSGIPGGGHGFECYGACKDLASDIFNCGSCGHVCLGSPGLINETRCDYGECMSLCDGRWTNTDTDRNNCHWCGFQCSESEDCIHGYCFGKTCLYGETLCGGTCTDIRSDRNNCGECGQRCSEGTDCVNGQCYNPESCPLGWADCDEDGRCENLSTGSGGYFCGSCDSMCSHNDACFAGQCWNTCPQGYSKCDRTCFNLMSNPEHCGECDKRCTDTQTCEAGQCVTPCPEGSRRCDGTCKPYTDFLFDNNNCGTCGNRCNVICALGTCLLG